MDWLDTWLPAWLSVSPFKQPQYNRNCFFFSSVFVFLQWKILHLLLRIPTETALKRCVSLSQSQWSLSDCSTNRCLRIWKKEINYLCFKGVKKNSKSGLLLGYFSSIQNSSVVYFQIIFNRGRSAQFRCEKSVLMGSEMCRFQTIVLSFSFKTGVAIGPCSPIILCTLLSFAAPLLMHFLYIIYDMWFKHWYASGSRRCYVTTVVRWSSLPTERLWGWKFGSEQQMTCRAVMFYHQVWLRQKAGGFLQYCDWQATGEKSHILSYNFVFVSSQQDQRSSLCLSQFPQVSAVILIWGCLGFFFLFSNTRSWQAFVRLFLKV